MATRAEPFRPGHYYHLYNRAVGEENLFRTEENYDYFLQRYAEYAPKVLSTFAYCLLPNHFHFLVRIHPVETLLREFARQTSRHKVLNRKAISRKVSHELGNWMNAYAKAYNNRYGRRGRLFVQSIRRKRITNERYLHKVVHCIHTNPVQHGFVESPEEWPFSSYRKVIDEEAAYLERDIVLEWFGGPDGYAATHQKPADKRLFHRMEH